MRWLKRHSDPDVDPSSELTLSMWPFKCKPIVDADTARWHADNFAWLVASFGGLETFADAILVLPRPGFFPVDGEEGHARAVHIFEQVKRYCGMDEWPIRLEGDDVSSAPGASTSFPWAGSGSRTVPQTPSATADTVRNVCDVLLAQPELLIASFAHGFARDLVATAPSAPPCADSERELLADLAAVYLGFGVFMANSVSDVANIDSGWRAGRSRYLPEQDVIFATALFIAAKELDPEPAYPCLKPHLAKMLKRALRDLTVDRHFVEQIRASTPTGPDDVAKPS